MVHAVSILCGAKPPHAWLRGWGPYGKRDPTASLRMTTAGRRAESLYATYVQVARRVLGHFAYPVHAND